MKVSFVIPTFNEERNIGPVIDAIRRHSAGRFDSEIIVVDNGSADGTAATARARNVQVLVKPGVTVAALRNAGAAVASGEVFVFLDGDVYLTEGWGAHISQVLASLRANPDIVTGSRCGVGSPESWIEKSWFKPLLGETPNYINSGHLVTTRVLFDRLHGFDGRLQTGEDYDLSVRARHLGASIVNDPALEVIHEGYPKTLRQFIRRELWHGQGSFPSFSAIWTSKIAPLTVAFLLLHVALVAALLAGRDALPATGLAALAILGVCGLASFAKYRRPFTTVCVNCYLYYWYFFARSLSLVSVLAGRRVPPPSSPGPR
jgi:glycosyltransferase involved in cell wall biosynthesis